MIRFLPLLPLTLLLAGCGGSGGNATAGGVSPAEAEALNQAAETLDRQAPPPRLDQAPVQAEK